MPEDAASSGVSATTRYPLIDTNGSIVDIEQILRLTSTYAKYMR